MKTSIHSTSILDERQKAFILQIWNSEYPSRLAFHEMKDLEVYLSGLKNPLHYFAENEADELSGWACTFERDHEKWFAMILNSSAQGQGLGSQLIQVIKKNGDDLNAWVIDHHKDSKQNGMVYPSPLIFYLKNNFQVCKDTRLETEKISAVKIKWNYNHNG